MIEVQVQSVSPPVGCWRQKMEGHFPVFGNRGPGHWMGAVSLACLRNSSLKEIFLFLKKMKEICGS